MSIGATLKTLLMCYEQGARASGRTTNMVAAIQDGDVVFFTSQQEARRVTRLLQDAGKMDVHIRVTKEAHLHEAYERMRGKYGKVHFDHSWVHNYYMRRIEEAEASMSGFITEMEARKRPNPRRAGGEHNSEIYGGG